MLANGNVTLPSEASNRGDHGKVLIVATISHLIMISPVVPAFGGFVVVGQMLVEYGVCTRTD